MAIIGLYLIIKMTLINDTETVISQYRLPIVHSHGVINNAASEIRIDEMLHRFITDKAEEQNMEKLMAGLSLNRHVSRYLAGLAEEVIPSCYPSGSFTPICPLWGKHLLFRHDCNLVSNHEPCSQTLYSRPH